MRVRDVRTPRKENVSEKCACDTECVYMEMQSLQGGEGQGEGEQSGPASETSSGADGRTGDSVWNKVSVVSDHPAILRDEPDKPACVTPLATSSPFSLAVSSSPRANSLLPASTGLLNFAGGFRGAQPRTAMQMNVYEKRPMEECFEKTKT